MELYLPWAQNKQTYQYIKEYRNLNDNDLAITPPHFTPLTQHPPTHTHTKILRHASASALPKMESCKITVSEVIYLNLARAQLRNGCLDPAKINEISETSKQRKWRSREWLVVSVWDLFSWTLTESKVSQFQSPRAGVVEWVAWVGRQPAFLSDNQLEDSDNLFRLKHGMADTLIHFAKMTVEKAAHCYQE